MQPPRYEYVRELPTNPSTRAVVAVDRYSGFHVVIKSLPPSLTEDPTRRDAFLEEVQRMRRAQGERLLEVLDTELEGPIPFVVTAYVEGPTVEQLVASEGPLSPAKTSHLGVGLCEALDTLHGTGLIHCDLAPNVNGQQDVLAGGHQVSTLTDSRSPCGRTLDLRVGVR